MREIDSTTGAELGRLEAPGLLAQTVALCPERGLALACSGDLTLRLIDLRARTARTLPGWHWVDSAAISPDGTRAVTGAAGGAVLLWDLAAGTSRPVLEERR